MLFILQVSILSEQMILYNIIKDEWARNKSKDDSTVSVRYKFPINLPKETKSVLVLFRCQSDLKKSLSDV